MEYKPVFAPYAHQAEALVRAKGRKAFAYLMAMRTGKTKVLIDEWGGMLCADQIDNLLVTAPAGAYKTWGKEVDKHLPPEIRQKVKVGFWESGAGLQARRSFQQFIESSGPRILVVNIEALSTVERCFDACDKFVRSGRTMIGVDESTTIKNHRAKRTRAVVTLGQNATWRRILSGLPAPTSPLDVYSQFFFLDPSILNQQNYYKFRWRYAILKKIKVGIRSVEIVVGYRNVEEIADKIAPHSYRVRLEDCYDVPPKLYVRRDVELTPEQKRLYDDLKQRATTQLASGEHVTATEVIVQMLRLHQLCCGHLVDEEGVAHEVPSRRVTDLLDLLREYDGKAVIWCSYDRDVRKVSDALRAELGDAAVACFWGANKQTREDDSRRFESDPQCTRMVATPGAGGRGRTWSVAGLLVYYSNTDNLEHRDQSEERASAVGRTERVTVVDMIAAGTVEEKIVASLRNKLNLAAIITKENAKEWLI